MAEARLDGARVQSHAHGLVPRRLPEINVQALGQLVDGGLAGAIRVPAAGRIVRDGPHARRHEREHGRVGQVGRSGHRAAALGEEGREVLDQEEGAERVDSKGRERVFMGYGRGRFFRVQDAGDAEGEPQRSGWETVFAVRGSGGDGGFVCRR